MNVAGNPSCCKVDSLNATEEVKLDTDIPAPRLGQAAALVEFIDPDFMCLPPTIRFPHPVLAHSDYGLCALYIHEPVLLFDRKTGKWFGPDQSLDADTTLAEMAMELAAVAKAPMDRITSVAWLPNGLYNGETPLERLVASPDPEAAASAIQEMMIKNLSGSNEPTSTWLGGYVASALGAKGKIPNDMKRLLAAINLSLTRALGDEQIVAFGHDISISDLVDPSFLLPALAIAAYEDWLLAARRKHIGTGFEVHLEPDPTALLGYRLSRIEPAVPFLALAPIVSTATRCKEGDEYYFDDIVYQFTRWLSKNGRDATILDEVEVRIASSS